MKWLTILLIVSFLFIFIFVRSQTLETRNVAIERQGVPYMTTEYIFHWDRFFNYLQELPRKMAYNLRFVFYALRRKLSLLK